MRAGLVAALALALAASALRAQQPLLKPAPKPSADSANDPHAVQPERPTVATHAGTVAPGWLEIETGVERDRFAPTASSSSIPTVFKFGLADRLQLSVFAPVQFPSVGSAGIGDVGAGVKWRLLENAAAVGDFAVLPSITFATGSPSTGTGSTGLSLLAISSHDLGGVAMDLNVGYTHRSGGSVDVPTSSTLWTLSFGGPFTAPWGWVAEAYGFPGTSASAPIVALLAGPTVTPRLWLAFDAGIIVPVSGPQPRALYAGAVVNVGQLWGPRR
ncbi:MAG: hypothetical protein JWM41_4240 [Gemmatimonadetes bacterium]|nr:hypothetical protein [Gemmatimonadota bacterium]